MATAYRSGALGHIQSLFNEGTYAGLSDARLLERFVAGGDESAFAALVDRHGALVRNTCRAVLKDPDDVADAFQATFVLLFRKAGSIRGGDAMGAWLHRVAYRIALQAQSDAARRHRIEGSAVLARADAPSGRDDLGALLHEEIERLPERFRRPVVLCYLEGMTRDQAADRLRCTEGTVRGRLAKGRELLRRRLERQGLALAIPAAAGEPIPESLVATTVLRRHRRVIGPGRRAGRGGLSRMVTRAIEGSGSGDDGGGHRGVGLRLLQHHLGPPDGRRHRQSARVPGDGTPGTEGSGRSTPRAGQAPEAGAPIPVEGRVLDLEGRPVAGATVSVQFVQAPPTAGSMPGSMR